MARKLKSDKVLFLAVLFLVCVSAVMVCSASAAMALQKNWDVSRFLFKQVTWVLVGFLLMGVTMRIHYRDYQQPFVIWSAIAGLALALLFVLFFAPVINGSRRWIGIGGIGVQPSELAKLVMVIFVADLLARRMERVNEVKAVLLPVGLVLGPLAGLILLQPDLGTAVFLVIVTSVLIFSAGLSYRYLVGPHGRVHPGVHRARHDARVPHEPHPELARSLEGSARRRLSDHPVPDRGRDRRRRSAAASCAGSRK